MTDLATLEWLVAVMAISLALHAAVMVCGAVAIYLAYRRATERLTRQLEDLTARADALSLTLTDAAEAVTHGAHALTAVVDDVRRSTRLAGQMAGGLATLAVHPKAAVAAGFLRGLQWWRRRRSAPGSSPGTAVASRDL